jgi:hypothetical protein
MERAHLSTNPLCARSIIRNALCLCIADDRHQVEIAMAAFEQAIAKSHAVQ